MKIIDLRSDTVTKPTQQMRQIMANAEVGDDVYGDDPSVNELEEFAAKLLHKEAALFVPSGTFSNQLAILTHTEPSNEVIALEDAHIVQHEVGAAALISNVTIRTARSCDGEYDLEECERLIRTEDIHYPKTALICAENAHSSGRVVALDHLHEVYKLAKEHNLPVHMDGARLANAAIHLGVPMHEIADTADTVSMCLSKGLGAPIGSVLLGSENFIKKATKYRKLLGGGLRQAGILAAAGTYALNYHVQRLEEDHTLANYLAIGLDEIDDIEIMWDCLDINMVFFSCERIPDLEKRLLEYDILINGQENGLYRLVTHLGIDKADIDRFLITMKELLDEEN